MENEKKLMSLINSVKVLNSTHDLNEVLHQLIIEVSNLIEGANASVLFLYDQRLDKLYAKSAIGFDMDYLKKVLLNPGEGMSGRTYLSRNGRMFSSETDTYSGMSNLSSENERLYAQSRGEMEYPMSAICVPLISNKDCIGVLTVDIYKESVQFDETELQLLETFAAQATIAIENATLFSQNERTKRIHEELSKVSVSKGGMEYITKSLSNLVGKSVVVLNEFMDVLSVSEEHAESVSNDLTNYYSSLLGEVIKQESISYYNVPLSGEDHLVYFFPIRAEKLAVGLLTVFINSNSELDPLDRFAIEQAVPIFAMEIRRQERLLVDDFNYSGSILEKLIYTPYEELSFNNLAKLNFPEHDKHHYVIAQIYIKDPLVPFQKISDKKQQLIRLIYHEISQLPLKTLVFHKNMEITLMFTASALLDEEQVYKKLSDLFSRIIWMSNREYQLSVIVGLGQLVENLRDVYLSYRDAKRCVRYLQSTDQGTNILTYKELGPYRLFLKIERNELLEYVDKTIGPIILYDHTHDTELLKTLKMFLRSNQNMSQSSKKLFVHVNTIKYRLKTIYDILNVGKLEGQKVFELQLGLNIFEYLGMTK